MCLGIPGKIIAITDGANRLATVEVAGVKREINIAFMVDARHPLESCLGSWVLVHVGFAMSRIDEQQAAQMLDLLNDMGELT